MNKILLKDAFFATLSVFIIMLILKKLLFLNFGFLDPVHAAVHHVKSEFENLITDVGSGKIANTTQNAEIYLVNLDTLGRAEIAKVVRRVEKWSPKVIGIDAVFDDPLAKPDSSLSNALRGVSNKLVTGTSYSVNRKGEIVENPQQSDSPYKWGTEGYTNFVSASSNEVVRSFLPMKFEYSKTNEESILPSFAAAIVKKYDPNKFGSFIKHRKGVDTSAPEVIVYSRSNSQYSVAKAGDILNDSLSFSEFKDKIVLLGYVGNREDLHYSSFNPNGNSPDMNGVIIHANIIEMILNASYMKRADTSLVLVISFMICFLMMIFFIIQFVKYHLWFHIVFKLVQLLSSIFIFIAGLVIFHVFHLQIQVLLIITPIALAVDVLYFYDSIVQWLHKRYGYKTYFLSSHRH
jgi:CHASE2 domain-containing sensor protein